MQLFYVLYIIYLASRHCVVNSQQDIYTLNDDVIPFAGKCKYNLLSSHAQSNIFPTFEINIKMIDAFGIRQLEYLEFIMNGKVKRLGQQQRIHVSTN